MEGLEVFFDGECGFCREMGARLQALDRKGMLVFRDYNDPSVAASALPRFTPADLAQEMHVRLGDGTWRIGFAAWAAILGALPRTRLLGRLLQFPPISEVGRAFYRWFAPRRRWFSKLLGLSAPCEPGGACKMHIRKQ